MAENNLKNKNGSRGRDAFAPRHTAGGRWSWCGSSKMSSKKRRTARSARERGEPDPQRPRPEVCRFLLFGKIECSAEVDNVLSC